jgi:hypothetical protein
VILVEAAVIEYESQPVVVEVAVAAGATRFVFLILTLRFSVGSLLSSGSVNAAR